MASDLAIHPCAPAGFERAGLSALPPTIAHDQPAQLASPRERLRAKSVLTRSATSVMSASVVPLITVDVLLEANSATVA